MNALRQDLRFGARTLLQKPGFTLIAVLSLALGTGANTAVFSLLDAVLLRSLPVQEPDRLVLFGDATDVGITSAFPNRSWHLYSYPFFREMRRRSQSFADVAAVNSLPNRVHGVVNAGAPGGELEKINAQLVSGSYFPTLGVKALVGRTLTDADDQTPGGHPVAVVSHSWWQRRFGGDPSIVGKTIAVGGTSYAIVGVTPQEFFGTSVGESPDLWVPLAMEAQLPPGWKGLDEKFFQSLFLIARLKPGVSAEQAGVETNLLFKQILQEFAGPQLTAEQAQNLKQARVDLTPAGRGLSELRQKFSLPLRILMGVVGIVLLIACANIANLMLARAAARRKEFAVRLALGAGRVRLVRQLLTESLLLAALGGVAGLLVAWWGSQALVMMVSSGPDALPLDVSPEGRVLGFTAGLALLSAVIFGLAPALRASKTEINQALKGDKGASTGKARSRLGKALVVAQVALSLLLLVGAGLFVRTLVNLQNVDTGYKADNVAVFQVDTDSTGLDGDKRLLSLYHEVEERVKAVPGVQAAAFSFFTFNQGAWTSPVLIQDQVAPGGRPPVVMHNIVGHDFFAAMGVPLVLGRGFGPQDTGTSQKVAVINETMAKRLFPGGSPVGKRFGLRGPQSVEQIEVVGVVKDARYISISEQPRPMAYYSHAQGSGYLNNLVVRYAGAAENVVPEVRRAIKEVSRNLPIVEVRTLSDQLSRSLTQQKLVASLSSAFGLLALVLACIGLYGVMAYDVARRTNEIGIRMALGAQKRDVLRLVMKESLTLVLAGIAVGVPVALATTRTAASLLYGLQPHDPLTYGVIAGLLTVVGLLACWVPARRAAQVDPMIALRNE